MKDYYSILQISRSANTIEIKAAYRNLSKKYHPDVNPAQNATFLFIEIKEAYEVLIDDSRRFHYNQLLDFAKQQQKKEINIVPTIAVFYCDNSEFTIGDVVTFTWEVFDADVVELRPFGKVEKAGSKKIRITEVSTNLLVELFCFNLVSKNYVFSQIVLKKREIPTQTFYETVSFDSNSEIDESNSSTPNQNKKINIFNFKINRPDGLEIFIWLFACVNLVIYFSYPYFFIKETELQAIRAFSNSDYGWTDYFIEFDDFKLEVPQYMAENLQAMNHRIVIFGTSTANNELAYYRIQTDEASLKENVSYYNNVGNFAVIYIFILMVQFYLTFIREKKSNDNFGFVLGFFFVFSLAMSYVLYSNLF
ncbi:DnaJ domain-containing protein [Flavobacterium sp. I3-2]|uniref:DnaJ domain-containing protein n=1 Tax=Flavobacterium sp. I3-2 TaxID=2748319 RepID=UPI0015AE1375|nr:DnaJ domain-containing protein [Flavobacterium sp. I3-2]